MDPEDISADERGYILLNHHSRRRVHLKQAAIKALAVVAHRLITHTHTGGTPALAPYINALNQGSRDYPRSLRPPDAIEVSRPVQRDRVLLAGVGGGARCGTVGAFFGVVDALDHVAGDAR
ncbi:hypothetical protein [Streptomyces milbemycinicus]|uniref:hypothetical protein n=1 Tax=Streptomyces milbemycinicus TaxID=476552 RepID=UPI0033C0C5A8